MLKQGTAKHSTEAVQICGCPQSNSDFRHPNDPSDSRMSYTHRLLILWRDARQKHIRNDDDLRPVSAVGCGHSDAQMIIRAFSRRHSHVISIRLVVDNGNVDHHTIRPPVSGMT